MKHLNLKAESQKIKDRKKAASGATAKVDTAGNLAGLAEVPYSHLHNHSQYSVLQSTTEIDNLINKALEFGMPAVALTDHSNLYGAYKFVNAIYNHPANKEIIEHTIKMRILPSPLLVKGVVGCELFVCKDHTDKTQKDNGYSQVFLAKNKDGYHNLAKMSSISFVDGYYYVPRVDRSVVEQYKEGLMYSAVV